MVTAMVTATAAATAMSPDELGERRPALITATGFD